MKITREINGATVEIELTSSELYDAYIEKQHDYDMEDVQQYVDECNEYRESVDPEIVFTDEEVSRIASRVRNSLDGNDMVSETLWDTIQYYVNAELKEV